MAFLLGRVHIIMPAWGLMPPGSTAGCQSRQNTLVLNYTAQNSWRGLESFGGAATDPTTDKGQRFARATPVSSGFAEPTGRQFHDYSIQPPGSTSIFRVFSCLSGTANAPMIGCNGTDNNKGSPILGQLPTALSTRIPAQASPGARRERRFPRSLKPSGSFLGVSLNDTLAVRGGTTKVAALGECGMPTVAAEGQFRFVMSTRENAFEPPHVHVWVGNEDVCRTFAG